MTQNTADFEKKARFKRKLRSVVSILLVFVSFAIIVDIIREEELSEKTRENNQYNAVVKNKETKESIAKNHTQNDEIKNIQNRNEEIRVSTDTSIENTIENATLDATEKPKDFVEKEEKTKTSNKIEELDTKVEKEISAAIINKEVNTTAKKEEAVTKSLENTVKNEKKNIADTKQTADKSTAKTNQKIDKSTIKTAEVDLQVVALSKDENSKEEKATEDNSSSQDKQPQTANENIANEYITNDLKVQNEKVSQQENNLVSGEISQSIENVTSNDIVQNSDVEVTADVITKQENKDGIDIYVVAMGDTLSHIVKNKYGKIKYMQYVIAFNNIENADFIKPDTLIYLPSISYLHEHYSIKKEPAKVTKEENLNANLDLSEYYYYIVKEGDNLSKIAKVFGMNILELLSYNEQLKNNPNLVKTNEVLKIPKTKYLMASNKD